MKRTLFNAIRGTLWAGAITILVFYPLMVIELVFFELLGLHPNLKTYSWFIAVCAGGYFACRQGRTSSWASLGTFAVAIEVLVISEIPEANQTFSELYPNLDPAEVEWHYSPMIFFTVPAALLGGFLWAYSNKKPKQFAGDDAEIAKR